MLQLIEQGEIDPAFIITHRLNLAEAPPGYELFKPDKDHCLKVVLNS